MGVASASETWANRYCTGRRIFIRSLRQKKLLRRSLSPEASIGQRIHASLEGEPENLERKAQEIRDDCARLAQRAARQYFGKGVKTEVFREERLWYLIGETPFFTGRPDEVTKGPKRLLDVNFKTGRGEEEDASLNLQLRTEVPLLKFKYPEIEEIGTAIVQPLVTHTPEIATYDEPAMHEALIEILEIVDATEWDATRTPGPWCKYCDARAFCPEARELALVSPTTIRVEALPSGGEASEMLKRVYVAEKILKAMKEAFKQNLISNPNSIPGWQISEGRKTRKWIDLEQAIAHVQVYTKLENVVDIPFGNLEDVLARAWDLKGKAFRDRFQEVFGEMITEERGEGWLQPVPKGLVDAQKPVD